MELTATDPEAIFSLIIQGEGRADGVFGNENDDNNDTNRR